MAETGKSLVPSEKIDSLGATNSKWKNIHTTNINADTINGETIENLIKNALGLTVVDGKLCAVINE